MSLRRAALLLMVAARPAAAEVGECHVVDVRFTPAMPASTAGERDGKTVTLEIRDGRP